MTDKQGENIYDLVNILCWHIKEMRKKYYKIKITQALCLYKIYYTICQLGWGKCIQCNCKITISSVFCSDSLCSCRGVDVSSSWIFFAILSFLKGIFFFFFQKSLSTSTKFNLQLHKGNYCSLGSQAFQQIPRNVQRKEWLSVLNCGLRGSYYTEYCLKVAI